MHKILIVEDNITIATEIAKQLRAWGYDTLMVEDFHEVVTTFSDFQPALVLLDISLPFFNGYHWCDEIRKISKVPIIFVSSLADNMNIVMAMNRGGDDFITKPFDFNVLTAKVQALLRRTYDFGDAPELDMISHRGFLLNRRSGSLLYQGVQIDLTKNEFLLLESLLSQSGEIVSREELMLKLWATDSFVDENTLTVNMTRLRKKLEHHGIVDLIATKKGQGYFIE